MGLPHCHPPAQQTSSHPIESNCHQYIMSLQDDKSATDLLQNQHSLEEVVH